MERSAVASVLRALQAYCSQVSEKETLTHGVAYYCSRFPAVLEANQFREVIAENMADAAVAFKQAEAWYREQDLTCSTWAPAGGDASDALAESLIARGFERIDYAVLSLTEWPTLEASEGWRILPARAMRDAFRATFANEGSPEDKESSTSRGRAFEERLDDPSIDAFVALEGKEPVGRCALCQVGEIGYVADVTVCRESEDRVLDRALLSHLIMLARRLALRPVCARVDPSDERTRSTFHSLGFEEAGTITEFRRRFESTPGAQP
jgi:hypothetical protein